MSLPNWFRILWWALLLGATTALLGVRFDTISSGNATPIDYFIFVFWVALLLVPIFSEINFLGVKVKSELKEFKDEVKNQIVNLRSEIQNSINVRTDISPQFNLTPPPPEAQLPAIQERTMQIIEDALRNLGISRPNDEPVVEETPENSRYLFSVRYQIERELRRIWNQRYRVNDDAYHHISINRITNDLIESQLIYPNLANAIREVYSMCSAAIHGERISERGVNFVRETAPGLLTTLRAID